MTDSSSSSPASAFSLQRVISIDSYAPGGEVILTVSGGAILTGENGAGKTSLIRLIPVFFGELPRRISVGTQSFGDFYLARTTSYIIFEYERRGVVCQAVIYAGSTDTNAEAYTYRFIRAPYSLGLFTGDDGKTIIPGDGLATHLKTLGIDHSRALAHDAYRAIIQGRAHAGRDAATNRAYVADYAFTPANNRLTHIDRIVSGSVTGGGPKWLGGLRAEAFLPTLSHKRAIETAHLSRANARLIAKLVAGFCRSRFRLLANAQISASSPLRSSRSSSLADGPLGCLSPISHWRTVETLVFNTDASTAWLIL